MKRKFFLLIIACLISLPAAAADKTKKEIVVDQNDFQAWLVTFKKEAEKKGISKKTIDASLKDIKAIKRIIELDRKQPEFTKTFSEYLDSVVPKSRVNKANKKYRENKSLLAEISKKFGVQERFIVALWGVETDFGARMGTYYVPEALATLAYEGRRREFFTKELINSLQIIDQGHIKHTDMKGSWAGAMGQTQFMPSSFLAYAVDYDGDGRKDIWGTRADAFASIANYLSKVGWNDDLTWGRKVKLPKNFSKDWIKKDKSLQEWQRLGVRKVDGSNLPTRKLNAMLSMPGGEDGPAYLVYENYKNILKWNRSNYFATAVGHLSDQIR